MATYHLTIYINRIIHVWIKKNSISPIASSVIKMCLQWQNSTHPKDDIYKHTYIKKKNICNFEFTKNNSSLRILQIYKIKNETISWLTSKQQDNNFIFKYKLNNISFRLKNGNFIADLQNSSRHRRGKKYYTITKFHAKITQFFCPIWS